MTFKKVWIFRSSAIPRILNWGSDLPGHLKEIILISAYIFTALFAILWLSSAFDTNDTRKTLFYCLYGFNDKITFLTSCFFFK